MRIAYVVLHLGHTFMQGGVGRKIRRQLKLWNDAGHPSELFLLTPEARSAGGAREFSFSISCRMPGLKFIARELRRSAMLARLVEAVREYAPDVIYLRYGLYTPPLGRLFSIAPVVVELNSNDIDEYRLRGALFAAANRLTRRLILKDAAAFIAVSREIGEYGFNRRYRKPTLVLANGIDLDASAPLRAPDNSRPTLVLVGSPGMSWHGVDKLLHFARRNPDLQFDIIGYTPQDLNEDKPENFRMHGYLVGEDLLGILARADVAMGTLALHRKNMTEASPLKVREALAAGLPVVLAYEDTDLSGLRVDWLLEIPNCEDNLITHEQEIRAFAQHMRGRRVDPAVLRPRIDQAMKEQKRLDFFGQMIHR